MTLYRLWAHFGSLRNTLVLLGLLAAVVLARPSMPLLGVVFVALGVNLLAALSVHPLLRRRLPLLVFHLALLALVLLVGAGRLLRMDGRFELLQGVPFDGHLIEQTAGALYAPRLGQVQLHNEGFSVDYAPGRRRGMTRNNVTWRDDAGVEQRAVIGDHRPLVVDGHRIYTTSNKGFAPVLRWQPDSADEPVLGAVHLPSYPMHELRQSREWTLPDGRVLWLMLQFDETLIAPDAAAQFRMPRQHRLALRSGDARFELTPGQALQLDGGTLVYEGLRSWMGYRVSHDPTLPWLLAAALAATLALAWHYMQAFRAPAVAPTHAAPRSGAAHA